MLFDRKRKDGQSRDGGSQGGEEAAADASVTQHRNRMAGLWAAELLGLIGHAAHDYAREVVHAHEHQPDDEHVVNRLARDLHGRVSVHEIREKLAHLLAEARRQLLHDKERSD